MIFYTSVTMQGELPMHSLFKPAASRENVELTIGTMEISAQTRIGHRSRILRVNYGINALVMHLPASSLSLASRHQLDPQTVFTASSQSSTNCHIKLSMRERRTSLGSSILMSVANSLLRSGNPDTMSLVRTISLASNGFYPSRIESRKRYIQSSIHGYEQLKTRLVCKSNHFKLTAAGV